LARMPASMSDLLTNSTTKLQGDQGKHGIVVLVLLAVVFLAVVVGVIAITESQRRIPTQSAKHVRGRRVYGGTKQYLPLKVNQAGVMPIIFASSLLMFPYFILSSLKQATQTWTIPRKVNDVVQPMSFWDNIKYGLGSFFDAGADAFQSHG